MEIEEGLNIDLDKSGKMIGLEVLDAVDRYSLADIFNISTENLILEATEAGSNQINATMKQRPPYPTFYFYQSAIYNLKSTIPMRPPL